MPEVGEEVKYDIKFAAHASTCLGGLKIMRMRTIIETGRQIAPVVNANLSELKECIDVFGQLLADLSAVKTEYGRAAMLEQCASGLSCLSESLTRIGSSWDRFDETLCCYKYKFNRGRKEVQHDIPGQLVMDFARAC